MKKMNSSRYIYPGTTLRIYKKGYGYEKVKVLHNTEQFISINTDNEFFSHINDSDSCDVYLWVEDVASYEFTTRVIGRISLGPGILFLEHTNNLKRYEERRCLSADVSLPFRFFVFDAGDMKKNFSAEDVIFHQGQIQKLSDRELSFTTDEKIETGHFLKGHVNLNGIDVELIGRIEIMDEKEQKCYLLRFTGMLEHDHQEILDYVFKTYRE